MTAPQRVPEAAPSSEAGQLGAALNHMLGRLDEAFDQQAASEDRLRRFVADASHELRTPVTTIRGYAELYRVGGLAERDELDEAMRRTEQEAVRMSRLVDDLINLAKLDEGRPLERREVDLTVLAADAARDAAAVDPGRPITHGPAIARAVVLGDEDRLRQVIANIVGNALVHTPAGTAIDVRVDVVGSDARLAVTDHGPGMPPDVAAKVTQRFYRADPARVRHRGGSGLGLSIADAAVVAHGGTIAVDSAVGRGTTVTVALPLGASSPGEPQGAVRSGSLDGVIPPTTSRGGSPMNRKHLAAAAIAATALLGGGAGIVSAQSDDDTTPTTVTDDTAVTDDTTVTDDTAPDATDDTAPARPPTTPGPSRRGGRQEGCGDGGGGGAGRGRGPGGAAPTETPSDAPATSTEDPASSLVSP